MTNSVVVASPKPTRYPAGISTDPPFGPLADFGQVNPFSYCAVEDDFTGARALNPAWTAYLKSTGSIAQTAGDGGRMLFTTAAAASDIVSLQTPVALMTFTALKKCFFLARLQMSSIAATGPTVVAGLCTQSATPSATPADGLYFSINSGLATLKGAVGGTTVALVTIPTTAYATQANPSAVAMAANTDYDFGFYVDRYQNIFAFFGQQLVGYLPQSGSGALYPGSGVSILPVVGPVGELRQSVAAYVLTAADLAPTLFLEEGTGAAAVTMNADFILAAKER